MKALMMQKVGDEEECIEMKSEGKSVVFGQNYEHRVMLLFCLWTLGLWGDTN